MALIRRKKNQSKQEKEDELLDLQLKQQRYLIKQMESDRKKERMQRFSNAAKKTGSFALKAITPTKSISKQDANEMMFKVPNEMLDTHREMFDTSKAFGNHSPKRGKKIYYRRVR